MSEEWIGILSLAILFGAIFIGFPIAFTLIAVALGVGYLALGPIALHLMTIQFFAVMKETSLASVPFFLFMGFLLEQSGLMERLFRGIQQLLAGVRGSLYLAVLITATIFAAATGIVGSSVTLLGVMAAPSMTRAAPTTSSRRPAPSGRRSTGTSAETARRSRAWRSCACALTSSGRISPAWAS